MIYKTIYEWLEGKFDNFNSSLDETGKLKMIEVNLDSGFLPASLKDKKYIIKFTGIKEDMTETERYTANVAIEFQFTLFKKPLEYYRQIIDEYLFRFLRLLQDDTVNGLEYEANGIMLTNIRNLRISDLNKLDNGGKYLMPVVGFDIETINTNSQ